MLTDRILPPDEWGKLAGTELEPLVPLFDATVRVVAIEDEHAVVGCAALFQRWHADGIWIAPAHQGRAAVGRALLQAVPRAALAAGADHVVIAATLPLMRRFCEQRARRIPGESYIWALKPAPLCY